MACTHKLKVISSHQVIYASGILHLVNGNFHFFNIFIQKRKEKKLMLTAVNKKIKRNSINVYTSQNSDPVISC